ncbi:MAG: tRNA uridine-5-carboxymethylaminomethyl(34) synthesis enzyme MnmG [Firmicutes bacterium]|nr:tRNA uridine-5-carboxymethylaminomethyl(34) synthesis enzyme MnmG [Bacillota bacterium]
MYREEAVDVAVIGAGHAGCEAALAAARMGMKTVIFAVNLDSIAMMPCNPSIGGTSKGHLVREVDALGGEMGKVIDRTFLQSRMLNTAKGPAVHSLRAQADKFRYKETMKQVLEHTPNLRIRQAEIADLDVQDGVLKGVVTAAGAYYPCKAAILATGTYLQAAVIHGECRRHSGPNGMASADLLSAKLEALGISLRRFKTGTPARVDGRTIDFDKMEEQKGDAELIPFSFTNTAEKIARPQLSCYLTYTTERTHEIIRANLHRSPLFSGDIKGTGPRYCPSIEDKVVRFADKPRHQIFLEPEGEFTNEYYVQGMSSSLPEDVQRDMLRTLIGMEHVEVMRTGYAIEYDCLDPQQLELSLHIKGIEGLYAAGQINGSSGYEEAAAQGIMAGINAALHIRGGEPFILDRSEAYIGVLIDDLVTKGTNEPYRMMTSRAEYRLLLRQDNADLRLTEKGYRLGLIDEERYQTFLRKKQAIRDELDRWEHLTLGGNDAVNRILTAKGTSPLKMGESMADLLKRPELDYEDLAPVDPDRPALDPMVIQEVMIQNRYRGYIEKQIQEAEKFRRMESRRLPADLPYASIRGLRIEAAQKLEKLKPASLGQASRISGVSPADIAVLLVYLKQEAHHEG